jgi:hypothetical protein
MGFVRLVRDESEGNEGFMEAEVGRLWQGEGWARLKRILLTGCLGWAGAWDAGTREPYRMRTLNRGARVVTAGGIVIRLEETYPEG